MGNADCKACGGTGLVPDSIDNYAYDPFCMAPCPSCSGSACARCRTRGSSYSHREPYIHSPEWAAFDSSDGLTVRADGTYECPTCGTRYDRRVEEASMFHDYDEYYFTKVD